LIFDPAEDARRSFGSGINEACFSSLEQLLWVREHEPDAFGRTRFVLQPKDFINYKLTGSLATNTLSAKGFCDLYTGKPRRRHLERVGIETTVLPEVRASDDIIGYTSPDAEALGIPSGVPVIAGEMDSVASILGTLQTESQISNVSGTSEIIGVVTENDHAADEDVCSRYLCYPYKDGLQLRLGVTKTGSACIDWFLDTFFKGSAGPGRKADRFLSEMTDYPRGPKKPPLLFLPYLNGERSPLWDPHISAGFLGVTSVHTLEDLYLSVLEGVGFSVLANVELLDPQYANDRSSISISGGGSRNQLLNQIKSDIVGKPLYRTVTDSSSSVGVAMLVASGGGIYESLFEAADAFVTFEEPYFPDRERHHYYTSLFSLYKEFYSNNIDWFDRLHRLHGH
jgi:xylulokinase